MRVRRSLEFHPETVHRPQNTASMIVVMIVLMNRSGGRVYASPRAPRFTYTQRCAHHLRFRVGPSLTVSLV